MPTGVLVNLGANNAVDAGDTTAGSTTFFTTTTIIGTGTWDWVRTNNGGRVQDSGTETGTFHLASNGNIYFAADDNTYASFTAGTVASANIADGTVDGTTGNDVMDLGYSDAQTDTITTGDDTIVAGAGDDSVNASGGNDVIFGGTGNDTIDGGDGNDSINGGDGNDILIGDETEANGGQDNIAGGAGDDIIYGDTAPTTTASPTVVSWANQGVADEGSIAAPTGLTATSADGTIEILATITQETNFYGASVETGDPLFNYNAVSDTSSLALEGGDITTGGTLGNDQNASILTLDFSAAQAGYTDEVTDVTFGIFDIDELQNQFLDQVIVTAYDANGVAIPVTVILGSTATLTSTTNADGSQTVTSIVNSGGAGNTDSQTGYAQFSVAGPVSYITIDYNNVDTAYGGHAIRVGDVTATTIPAVSDAGNDDTLAGDAGADIIYGQGGDDIIDGGADNDTIYGGAGSDQIILGNGFGVDTIDGTDDIGDADIDVLDASSMTTNATLDLSGADPEAGTLTSGANVATFDNIETVTLGAGADSVIGSDGDDSVTAGTGADTINMGAGNDTVDLGAGTADDTVFAGIGDDTIYGEAGNDFIVASNNDDLIFGGANNDFIFGGNGADSIDAGTGNDILNGGTGADTLLGGDGADEFVQEANFGNDTITGGEGGLDNDEIRSTQDINTTTVLTGDEAGTITDGTSTATFTQIESIDLQGGDDVVDASAADASITVFGGDGADSITGSTANDVLNGETGNDTIDGGAGNDAIDGGFGDDTIIGGESAETDGDVVDGSGLTQNVTVTFSGTEAGTITNGPYSATFSQIEQIVTGAGDGTITAAGGDQDVITGAGDDVVTTTGTGADTIATGAGNDTIIFSEGDSISGGTGDDTFTYENLGEPTNGTITIVGGQDGESPDDGNSATLEGDTLNLGFDADFSTLNITSTTTNVDGKLSYAGSITMDDGTLLEFSEIENIICFTPGTRIATPQCARDIATLKVGDMVVTRDHGLQPIRWIQQRTLPAAGKFAPIRIKPGVVTGQERDLLVSPQHRMMFQGYRAELLFGESEVLVSAKHLVDGKSVTQDEGGDVTYIHMMFNEHEVVYAEGAATESFHPGDVGLSAVSDPARDELFTLFPDLRSNIGGYGDTARRCLKHHEARLLHI